MSLLAVCLSVGVLVVISNAPVLAQNNHDWTKMPDTQRASPQKEINDWQRPERACFLLDDLGLKTTGYKNYAMRIKATPEPWMPKEYSCLSPYSLIPGGFPLESNLAYYAAGDQDEIKELKLVLNVNDPGTVDRAHRAIAIASDVLTKRALGAELADDVLKSLLAGRSGKWKAGKNQIEVFREDWPTGKGYEVKFFIR